MKDEKNTCKSSTLTAERDETRDLASQPLPSKKDWVRLIEDRPFSSSTGSDFRVWGKE
jgi:hypothetical protein